MTEVDDEDENNLAFDNIVGSDGATSSFALVHNYNIPIMSAAQFIIGVGAVRSNYAAESSITSIGRAFQYNYGVSGLAGIRFRVANRVAIRVDGIADYHKDTENLNLAGRAGLSLLIGGARPEVMCTYAGLENIPASSPQCVAASAASASCTDSTGNVPVSGSGRAHSD